MRDYAKKIKSRKSTKSRAAYKLKKTGNVKMPNKLGILTGSDLLKKITKF